MRKPLPIRITPSRTAEDGVAVAGVSKDDFVTIAYREVLPAASIVWLPGTGIRIRFSGTPGRTYNIERSPAVSGPWSIITSRTAPPSGIIDYTNATPVAPSFYRTSGIP
jgi:hypothetical protein